MSPKAACRASFCGIFLVAFSAFGLLTAFGQDIPPLEEIGRALFEAVNRERAALDIPPLRPNPALVELARRQSEDMARSGTLAHGSPAGKSFTERLNEAGVLFAANAENVARSGSPDPEFIHASFMKSPGHREAILNPEFDEAGIAVARGADGAFYVTQDFVKSLVPLDEPEVRARRLEALDMSDTERREAVLAALNEVRAGRNRRPLALDKDLSRKADEYNHRYQKGEGLIPPRKGTISAVFYETQNLGRVPDEIRGRVSDREYRRVGISVLPLQPGASFSARFSVAVLFED